MKSNRFKDFLSGMGSVLDIAGTQSDLFPGMVKSHSSDGAAIKSYFDAAGRYLWDAGKVISQEACELKKKRKSSKRSKQMQNA